MKKIALLIVVIGLAIANMAQAAIVDVSADISTSTTWTSDNTYRLKQQIYVLPGATLTIEAGTLIQTLVADQGSLAVCRGAQIYANGTKTNPIIFTSSNDTLTAWHEGCNEWGNLTIMGDALISASHYAGLPVGSNTKEPTGLNEKQMEGLTDPVKSMYGGDNDNDNSGSITYVSLRYGGKVVGLANELNGLSLGGIGRETDIHHIEIMNNVDDGIEIWGGTVNLSFLNIWNIGDDSLDIDEGYRGKIQYGLIVQGYSTNASQGSGVGDNCVEIDGAEAQDAQPVTTTSIYNFTLVGQPIDGDHATAWRDNARVQYRNCIMMEMGEKVVAWDDEDGDGALGYDGVSGAVDRTTSADGTLSWQQTWTTPYTYSTTVAMPNAGSWTAGAFNDPSVMYTVQTSGNLAEISDCVFYNNLNGSAYTEYNTVSGYAGANNVNNVTATLSPIQSITRGAIVTRGGKNMVPVTHINPCAANDAVSSVATAPSDGFFVPAPFRGGFSATHNWLEGWTSVDAYGMTDTTMNTPNGDLNDNGIVELGDLMLISSDWLRVI
jgi:hypothetical protein